MSKLERFFVNDEFFKAGLIVAGKLGAYLSVVTNDALTLTRLSRKQLTRTKHSSLFFRGVKKLVSSFFRDSFIREVLLKGKAITVDLVVLNRLNRSAPSYIENSIEIFTKQAILIRRSTVLSLSL
jgi:hypothetical protein